MFHMCVFVAQKNAEFNRSFYYQHSRKWWTNPTWMMWWIEWIGEPLKKKNNKKKTRNKMSLHVYQKKKKKNWPFFHLKQISEISWHLRCQNSSFFSMKNNNNNNQKILSLSSLLLLLIIFIQKTLPYTFHDIAIIAKKKMNQNIWIENYNYHHTKYRFHENN